MQEELEKAQSEARSFPELKPPVDAVYLGKKSTENDTYYYYRYKDKYLFESERGLAFKMHMEEVEKKLKAKRRWQRKG